MFNIIEDLLSQIKEPADYKGPSIELVLKEAKEENLKGLIDTFLKSNVPPGKNIAIYMKNEDVDGDLTKVLTEQIKSNGY